MHVRLAIRTDHLAKPSRYRISATQIANVKIAQSILGCQESETRSVETVQQQPRISIPQRAHVPVLVPAERFGRAPRATVLQVSSGSQASINVRFRIPAQTVSRSTTRPTLAFARRLFRSLLEVESIIAKRPLPATRLMVLTTTTRRISVLVPFQKNKS